MICPSCTSSIRFSWRLYLNAPVGILSCPHCSASLRIVHKWFYLPAMLGGCALGMVVGGLLGHHYAGPKGALVGIVVCGAMTGFPFDWWLEATFAVAHLCETPESRTSS